MDLVLGLLVAAVGWVWTHKSWVLFGVVLFWVMRGLDRFEGRIYDAMNDIAEMKAELTKITRILEGIDTRLAELEYEALSRRRAA
jgi:hypothetical protein